MQEAYVLYALRHSRILWDFLRLLQLRQENCYRQLFIDSN